MDDFQFDQQSDFVKKQIAVRKNRDDRTYDPDNMEYWIKQDVKDFIIDINHEILRELLETEHWMRCVLEESEVTSIIVPKLGKQITVKDACQLAIVRIGTMKKILRVMKKYADVKHSEESQT